MATTKPRINVTLEPHRYELFKRLAALQGVSMSALVADLLETIAEPMERVCVVLEAALKAPAELKTGLRAAVDRAEGLLMPSLITAHDQLDMFLEAAVSGIEAAGVPVGGCVSGRPTGTSTALPDPRLVTRGSTPLSERINAAPKPRSKASKGKALDGSVGVLEEKPARNKRREKP